MMLSFQTKLETDDVVINPKNHTYSTTFFSWQNKHGVILFMYGNET